MIKNYFLFLFCLFIGSANAQENDVDKQGLFTRELQNYNKMTTFNVNPNTLNYDLKYQRLDVTINPSLYQISGSVTSHFLPNQNMSAIYFDLSPQLTVSQVSYHGNNLTFQQLPTKELRINFTAPVSANVLDSLTVKYSGAPDPTNDAFRTGTQNGIAIASTLSEPYGAQDWFPTKQSMNDKIDRMDFKIITPNQYDVAANGRWMSETPLAGNQKLTFWRTQYPMSAYLAAFSITTFTKINDVIGNPPFPFVNYLFSTSANNSAVMSNIAWTKDAMTLFETYFGPYPFRNEKYGHMEFQYNGVCMEHQTMSSMSSWGRPVIAHELAHQWFGDKVTCGAWNDIWLNEGFATFGEHLAYEKLLLTPPQFRSYLLDQKNYITSAAGGSTYVADANLGNVGTVFSGRLSYSKGGYILRMLKWVLGENLFYQSVQDYHSRPNLAYNYAKTEDLKNSLLLSTGRNFTEFFNDWVYGQGYPTYTIKWAQNPTDNTLFFKVGQTQSHPAVSFFEMPLPIKITGPGGQVLLLSLENTANNQTFSVPATFSASSVEFNYDYQILESNSTVTNDATLSLESSVKEELVLYPSPATSEIKFRGLQKGASFKIYATDGKLIKSGVYMPASSISVKDFVPGIYFINISGVNLKFTKK